MTDFAKRIKRPRENIYEVLNGTKVSAPISKAIEDEIKESEGIT